MEDFKFILYILAAVAYFVFMQWRKAFNTPKQDLDNKGPKREHKQQYPTKPVTSFEDIIRELQPKLEKAETKTEKAIIEGKEKVKSLMPTNIPKVAAIPMENRYEDRPPKALSWEKPTEAKQLAILSADHLAKKRFESYDKRRKTPNRYASLLRNPNTVKEAVVLSEIFKRKYN